MADPNRNVTSRCIKLARDSRWTHGPTCRELYAIASQLEQERDFADRLNSELGEKGAQMVRLCEGLVRVKAKLLRDHGLGDDISAIGELLASVGWEEG